MSSSCFWGISRAVHPRTRGEHHCQQQKRNRLDGSSPHTKAGNQHCSCSRSWTFVLGSSPHTRGTYANSCFHFVLHRFIPAHAGNIRRRRSGPRPVPVHPRTRGEHSLSIFHLSSSSGSSPHTRGTCRIEMRIVHVHRFIPAHAGNIRPCLTQNLMPAVHPRTRGEH